MRIHKHWQRFLEHYVKRFYDVELEIIEIFPDMVGEYTDKKGRTIRLRLTRSVVDDKTLKSMKGVGK